MGVGIAGGCLHSRDISMIRNTFAVIPGPKDLLLAVILNTKGLMVGSGNGIERTCDSYSGVQGGGVPLGPSVRNGRR